jgi:hypothetical protein
MRESTGQHLNKDRNMLHHSYQAELNGSQLRWIDEPPAMVDHRRVLVVLEGAAPLPVARTAQVDQPTPATVELLTAFMRAEGCLGTIPRVQLDAELSAMRDEWDRPLGL